MLTIDQVKGLSFDVAKIVMGGVSTLVAFKLLSSGDASAIQANLDAINKVVAEIGAIILTLGTVYTSFRTIWINSPLALMLRGSKAAAANPSTVQAASVAEQTVIVQATNELPKVNGIVAAPEISNSQALKNITTIVSPSEAKALGE